MLCQVKKLKYDFKPKPFKFFILILLVSFTNLCPLSVGSNEILEVGKFSAASVRDDLPSNWKSFAFKGIKKPTRYTMVKDNGIVVVKASSDRSASGLIRKIMIVVQSGESRINTWIVEEQNVYEDYQKIFGNEPPMIAAVGIMTDTDDTEESALSLYGDIVFKCK